MSSVLKKADKLNLSLSLPDNAGLVTPNSNKGTNKQLQQLQAFTKQLHFPLNPTTTEPSK